MGKKTSVMVIEDIIGYLEKRMYQEIREVQGSPRSTENYIKQSKEWAREVANRIVLAGQTYGLWKDFDEFISLIQEPKEEPDAAG